MEAAHCALEAAHCALEAAHCKGYSGKTNVLLDLQIQGKDRSVVAEAGRRLGLDGTYIARSYIEQVRLLLCAACDGTCVALSYAERVRLIP